MHSSVSFSVKFLRYLQTGLNRSVNDPSASSTVMERKKDIKLAADTAMALSRGGRRWSRALISNLRKQETNQDLSSAKFPRKVISKGKKILLGRKFRKRPAVPATLIALRIMKKRTRVLQRLVPGGGSINELSVLLDEALDYLISLRAQADLMRRLVYAIEQAKCPLSFEAGSRVHGGGAVDRRAKGKGGEESM